MAVDTQPTTLSDLRIALLSRVRDVGSTTVNANSVSVNDLADSALNTALMDFHISPMITPYWAINHKGVLITHAPYTTGTVSITAATSRTAVVGASTLWATAVTGFGFNNARAGGKMKFSGLSEIYDVSTVSTNTAMELSTLYTGADLSGASYTYFEDEYALASDFLWPADMRMFSTDLNIRIVGWMDFKRRYVRNDTSGKPRVATFIDLDFSGNTTPRPRVVLHPYPDDEHSIPYSYITSNLAVSATGTRQAQMTADTDEPIIPLRFRYGLVLCALKEWYRDRKDDLLRYQAAKGDYESFMVRTASTTRIGQNRPQFRVRRGSYGGSGRSGVKFDGGAYWDELRDRK